MTLESVARVYLAVWWIRHPDHPCTDPHARHIIQDARINAITTTDNKQDQ